jgi:hypothetical protein
MAMVSRPVRPLTLEQARAICTLAEQARLAISRSGEVPADWVAREYCGGHRGRGLTLLLEAQRVLHDGVVCDHCQGTGRVR